MKNFKDYKAITMKQFVEEYLNYYSDNDNYINHYDISELDLSGVKRIPNDLVTKEDLETGKVILVKASGEHHNGKMICAYLRPDIVLYSEREMSKLDEMIFNALYKDDCPKSRKRKR